MKSFASLLWLDDVLFVWHVSMSWILEATSYKQYPNPHIHCSISFHLSLYLIENINSSYDNQEMFIKCFTITLLPHKITHLTIGHFVTAWSTNFMTCASQPLFQVLKFEKTGHNRVASILIIIMVCHLISRDLSLSSSSPQINWSCLNLTSRSTSHLFSTTCT